MFKKREKIFIATGGNTLEEMCCNILMQAASEGLLKIVFFCSASNDNEYLGVLATLRSTVDKFFQSAKPLISYIAQKPGDSALAAEALYLADADACIERHRRYTLLKRGECTEIITEGIVPGNVAMTAFEQSM